SSHSLCFFFNDTATTEIYPLSLHDALPIFGKIAGMVFRIGHIGDLNDLTLVGTLGGVEMGLAITGVPHHPGGTQAAMSYLGGARSEEHTSELQSLTNLVCRLLLEKKNNN